MVNSGRKLFLQAASVLMAIIMLMFQFVQFPPAVTAASTTDIYVGYSGKSNNYNTVTELGQNTGICFNDLHIFKFFT